MELLHIAEAIGPDAFSHPFVITTDKGYFAYGCEKQRKLASNAAPYQVSVLHSHDLITWEPAANEPIVATQKRLSSPAVIRDGTDYYLFYSTQCDKARRSCIHVGRSSDPQGPFVEIEPDLLPHVLLAADPHPFRDPVSGELYLFFTERTAAIGPCTRISTVRLGEEMQVLTAPQAVLEVHGTAACGVEAPAVIYKDSRYHLFFSAGDERGYEYGIGYASSSSVEGPFALPSDADAGVVVESIAGMLRGPGHPSIVPTPDGVDSLLVFDSWNSDLTSRRMHLAHLSWPTDSLTETPTIVSEWNAALPVYA